MAELKFSGQDNIIIRSRFPTPFPYYVCFSGAILSSVLTFTRTCPASAVVHGDVSSGISNSYFLLCN